MLCCCSCSPAGDELTWLTPSLGVWYSGLLQRDAQYRLWLSTGRPVSFWMTGFFNPQGFLTAVQQEITRAHKHENWALDSVVLHSDVTDLSADHVKTTPRVSTGDNISCVCFSLCVIVLKHYG
jgi:dynein heavy chain